MYMPPPSADMGTYGMQTCGLLPSLAKREVNHQNMGMNVHPYIPQVDSWTDPNRSCRIEQPVTQQVPTCSFTTNIKEESNCCMYSDKRNKLISAEVPSYQRLVPESCPVENPEVPVPGYFRLSQTYATGKTQEYNNSPEGSSTVMLQLNPRGAAKPQLSAAQLQMEKKMNEPASGQEPTKVSQVESPEAKGGLPEERSCLGEVSVSSPEVQEKESKGRYKLSCHPSGGAQPGNQPRGSARPGCPAPSPGSRGGRLTWQVLLLPAFRRGAVSARNRPVSLARCPGSPRQSWPHADGARTEERLAGFIFPELDLKQQKSKGNLRLINTAPKPPFCLLVVHS